MMLVMTVYVIILSGLDKGIIKLNVGACNAVTVAARSPEVPSNHSGPDPSEVRLSELLSLQSGGFLPRLGVSQVDAGSFDFRGSIERSVVWFGVAWSGPMDTPDNDVQSCLGFI